MIQPVWEVAESNWGITMKKKYLYRFLILALAVFIIPACESDDTSHSKDDNKLMEITCQVQMKSYFGLESGDLAFFDCTDKRIIFTTETTAIRQRSSCSGFDSVGCREISIGDILMVKYNKKDTNYSLKPITIRATSIEAYRHECLIEPVP